MPSASKAGIMHWDHAKEKIAASFKLAAIFSLYGQSHPYKS